MSTKVVRTFPWPTLALLSASAVLVIFAWQYPLQTTFPLGGDAAIYVTKAKLLLNNLSRPLNFVRTLSHSWYPLSDLVFTATVTIPLSWPARFVYFAAVSQIAVGLAIGWLLFRTHGWAAAAAGITLWAITTMKLDHFEDGTIAQLFSYLPAIITLERLHSGRLRTAFIMLFITLLAHPITGLVLSLSLAASLPAALIAAYRLPQHKSALLRFAALTGGLIIILVGILFWRNPAAVVTHDTSPIVPLYYHLYSLLLPTVLLAPLGVWLTMRQYRQNPLYSLVFLSLSVVILVLSVSPLIGLDIWSYRLAPYFVLLVVLGFGPAWPYLLRKVFRRGWLSILITTFFFSSLVASTWQQARNTYYYYESPSHYARLHPTELEAINWLKENLSASSTILTSNINRHSEWIEALTPFKWIPMSEKSGALVRQPPSGTFSPDNPIYLVFFLNREEVPPSTWEEFIPVYQNEGAAVFLVSL